MSEFENKSLQELANLLAGAEPRALMARGDALLGLAEALGEIGTLIAGRMERVEWEGEAATQFREWGRSFARESRALDEFTRHVGEAIRQAGQALSEAQSSMPKGPATGPVIDPAKGSAAGTGFHGSDFLDDVAAARAEEDRQEAIRVMERLSSHYRIAAQQIGNAEAPAFDMGRMGELPGGGATQPGLSEDGRVTPYSSGAPPTSPHNNGSGSSALPSSREAASPHPALSGPRTAAFDESVGTSLDSVAPGGLPTASSGGPAPGAAPVAGAAGQAAGAHSPVPLPWGQPTSGSRTHVPAGPTRPIGGKPPTAARPPRGLDVTPGSPPRTPGARDGSVPGVGRPSPAGGTSRAATPLKGGADSAPTGGRPTSGAATSGTPAKKRPTPPEGIVGGTRRPAEPSTAGSRLPKGAVIGPTSPTQAGRSPQERARRTSRNYGPVIGVPPSTSERNHGRNTSNTHGIPRTGPTSLKAGKMKGELPKDRGGIIGLPGNQEKRKGSSDDK